MQYLKFGTQAPIIYPMLWNERTRFSFIRKHGIALLYVYLCFVERKQNSQPKFQLNILPESDFRRYVGIIWIRFLPLLQTKHSKQYNMQNDNKWINCKLTWLVKQLRRLIPMYIANVIGPPIPAIQYMTESWTIGTIMSIGSSLTIFAM